MAKKARKWSNLKGQVPEAPVELSEREIKVRAAMDERRIVVTEDGLRPATMKDYAAEYAGLCEEEDFESLAGKDRSVKYEALERLIRAELTRVEEISGQDTWRGEGQTFSPKTTPIPVVVDKTALMQYIKDEGLESLLELPSPRLKSMVTDKLEELVAMTPAQRAAQTATLEQPIPGVKVWLMPGIHRTKS